MVSTFTPPTQLSILKDTPCYNSFEIVFNYFTKTNEDITYQSNFLEFLNLNRVIDGNGIPVYSDKNLLNTVSKNYDSEWYMNWLGDGKDNISKLQNYLSIINILTDDNYKLYFPYLQNIGQYLFLKFLNTKIYGYDQVSSLYKITNYYPLISQPGSLNYTPLQDILHDFFLKSKGILNSFLQTYATSLNLSDLNGRNMIGSSQVLMEWIGCFSPNLVYKDSNGNMVEKFSGNNKSCDPLCYGLNKIQIVDENGDNQVCNANICVLNNINIDSVGNQNISFTQVCPACSDTKNSNCLCIIDESIPGILGKVNGLGNTNDFKQNCPNSTCLKYNPKTGILEYTTCQEDNIILNNNLEEDEFTFFGLTKIIPKDVILLILFIIFVMIILYIS